MNHKPQSPNRTVKLRINELVLNGFPPQDRQRIAQAVQQELTRLLSRGPVPSALTRGGAIPGLDGGEFHVKHGATPEQTGVQVARNLYGGLKR